MTWQKDAEVVDLDFGYWPQEAQDAILRRDAEIVRLTAALEAAEERRGMDIGEAYRWIGAYVDELEQHVAELETAMGELRDLKSQHYRVAAIARRALGEKP